MDIFLSILSCAVSISALIIAMVTFRNSRISTVKDFFQQGDSDEQKKYRRMIYYISNEQDSKLRLERLKQLSDEAAAVISFYDFWAIMVRKKYLSIWTFYGMAGKTAENIYNILIPYIAYRREKEGYELYGMAFELLVKKIYALNTSITAHMFKQ